LGEQLLTAACLLLYLDSAPLLAPARGPRENRNGPRP
jgi:hypothetical protein